MEEKKNKYLTVSAIVLLSIAIAFFLMSREENSPEIDPDYFSLVDTDQIDKVTLRTLLDTVVLRYEGSRWRVNDRWEADVQMIKVLMATLRQTEPHRMVSRKVIDTVQQQLEQRGTEVVVEKEGVEVIKFLAGGNAQRTESWFLKAGDTRPYVMIIPGYRVYVSGIFQLEAEGWRNKRIFEFNWRNFKSLTTSYSKEPKLGFTIEMKQSYFGIREMAQVDTTKLNDYLDAVSLLEANRFVPGPADRLLKEEPSARIDIRDIADRIYTLELFAPQKDATEVFGRMADGQLVAFDRNMISSIARRRTYFVASGDR